MDIAVRDLWEEAKIMALEIRMKDRQIASLQEQLESAKKVNDESAS